MIEAVLEPPRQLLLAQQFAARGKAVEEMKADGIEYEERMELLEEITWPKPLGERLEALYESTAAATRGCRRTRSTRSRWSVRCTRTG